MKRIQCLHIPHQYNDFVATCRFWLAIGGVHALLVLDTIVQSYINIEQSHGKTLTPWCHFKR